MKYFNFLGIILITLMSVISHTEYFAKEQNEENIDIKINGKKCTQNERWRFNFIIIT